MSLTIAGVFSPCICPTKTVSFTLISSPTPPSCKKKTTRLASPRRRINLTSIVTAVGKPSSSNPETHYPSLTLGFESLMKTFPINVTRAEGRPLNVPLTAPFTIATSRLDSVGNVAIRVELHNGCVGWGEAPILPFVTAEDLPTALAKANAACQFLVGSPTETLGKVLNNVGNLLPNHDFASVRILK